MFISTKQMSDNFPPTKLGTKTDYIFNTISVAKHRDCFVPPILYRQQPLPQIWSTLVTKSADQTPFSLTTSKLHLSKCNIHCDVFFVTFSFTWVSSSKAYCPLIDNIQIKQSALISLLFHVSTNQTLIATKN